MLWDIVLGLALVAFVLALLYIAAQHSLGDGR